MKLFGRAPQFSETAAYVDVVVVFLNRAAGLLDPPLRVFGYLLFLWGEGLTYICQPYDAAYHTSTMPCGPKFRWNGHQQMAFRGWANSSKLGTTSLALDVAL